MIIGDTYFQFQLVFKKLVVSLVMVVFIVVIFVMVVLLLAYCRNMHDIAPHGSIHSCTAVQAFLSSSDVVLEGGPKE